MAFFRKLFGRKTPTERVRICSECGMPVAQHKQWCSILRGQAVHGVEPAPAVTTK